MHNELFSIGQFTIYGYGLMIAIGIFAAYLSTEFLAKKNGLDANPVFNILIVGVLSGILGAKLLYYITILDDIIANPKLSSGFQRRLCGIRRNYRRNCSGSDLQQDKGTTFLEIFRLRSAFHCTGKEYGNDGGGDGSS